MANELSLYYDRQAAQYKDYKSYIGELANRQVAAIGVSGAMIAESVDQSISRMQTGITTAIDNQTYELVASQEALGRTFEVGFNRVNNTLDMGFAGVSNQLGALSASFSVGAANIVDTIEKMSDAVCAKLDAIHGILNNPLLTQARELYRRAAVNYSKGFYEEALEDLKQALEKNKTDYLSWFLLGKVYTLGAGKFSNVISLDNAINALTTAAKYISPDFNADRPGKIGTYPVNIIFNSYNRSIGLLENVLEEMEMGKQSFFARDSARRFAKKMPNVMFKQLVDKIREINESNKFPAFIIEPNPVLAADIKLYFEHHGESVFLEIGPEETAQFVAAEIRFYMGLAKYSKSNELNAFQKTEEARTFLVEAQKDYERSYQYSDRMVESLYNTARCKALLGDKSGALVDLEAAIKGDAAYCIKMTAESDFDAIRGEYPPLVEKMKAELYREALAWIQSVYTKVYPGFSADISMDMPYFDMRTRYDSLKQEIAASEAPFWTEVNNDGFIAISDYVGKATDIVIPAFISGKPVTIIANDSLSWKKLKSVVIPNGVIHIGYRAFSNNQLTSLVIPDGVTYIGNEAFNHNPLKSLVIPSSVTSIETTAFDSDNLTSITIGANVELKGQDFFYKDRPCEQFVYYYNNNGKLAGTYTYDDKQWSSQQVRLSIEAKNRQRQEEEEKAEEERRRVDNLRQAEEKKINRWTAIGALLGLVPLVGGFVVGHWFIGILIGIAATVVGALAFLARGWGILALALIGGGIALGIHLEHPFIGGIIAVIAGLVVWGVGASKLSQR
jgi:tetratricopeptide (TPR) repeat protein